MHTTKKKAALAAERYNPDPEIWYPGSRCEGHQRYLAAWQLRGEGPWELDYDPGEMPIPWRLVHLDAPAHPGVLAFRAETYESVVAEARRLCLSGYDSLTPARGVTRKTLWEMVR